MKKNSSIFRFIQGRIGTFLIAFLVLLGIGHTAQSQGGVTITGTVTDGKSGESLPGVTILVKGTNVGAVTDLAGSYSIRATSSDVLVFSFMGYLTEEVAVLDRTVISITLSPDIVGLEEIVVIGYGVQRKKLNTGATVNVSGENIQSLNPNSAMEALKGISAGVSIMQNNGQPGAGSRVFVRGIGTIGNANPLYIVDGISVGNIDYLSPNDIESIDILKDAASAAIYGSRAANGVILVTTRKGRKDMKAQVAYDAYFGFQNIVNEPQLLNAQQYMEIMDEKQVNSARPAHNYQRLLGDSIWNALQNGTFTGTNWFEEMRVTNAPVQSHSVNVTGGSKQSIYSIGASYFHQQGVLGPDVNSAFQRMNLRMNTEHILFEHKGRNAIVFGQNLTYTNAQNPALRTGNIYWNDLRNALVTHPLLPMYSFQDDGEFHYAVDWESSHVNPIALMEYQAKHNTNNNNTLVGNAYLELQPVNRFVLRSSIGLNNWYGSSRHWRPAYDIGPRTSAPRDRVSQSMYTGYSWTLTNTASYEIKADKHSVTLLAGNEMTRTARSLNVSGSNENGIFDGPEFAYLDNYPDRDPTYMNLGGRDDYGGALLSYFSRISYDFDETYLLTLVMRADGSSNFARGNRWGYFPSVSAGWILTNESFMAGTSDWLNFLKIRGSWGQNGNESIGAFRYSADIAYSDTDGRQYASHYFFGPDRTIRTIGSFPARIPNPNVSWETSEQTNIGADIFFLASRLQFNVDWYSKDTRDWLVQAPAPLMWGARAPWINGGHVNNTGFELMARWNDRRGELHYGISASVAFNKNEIIAIDNDEKIIHGQSNVLSQGTGEMYRAEVGYPIGYFWGYQTDGILQDSVEVDAWRTPEGELYFANQAPGDVRFVDQNKDGSIDELDKVMIGNPNPDFIFGFQLNADYKGAYVQVTANGMAGHQIALSYRSYHDGIRQNYTTDVYERWHGKGTSDRMPRLQAVPHRNTGNISDIFIHDGDFLRISNLTIGYDLSYALKWIPFQETKLYFTVRNLATFTKYRGMDPEVGYGPDSWSSGIDLGLYPSARTISGGVSIKF